MVKASDSKLVSNYLESDVSDGISRTGSNPVVCDILGLQRLRFISNRVGKCLPRSAPPPPPATALSQALPASRPLRQKQGSEEGWPACACHHVALQPRGVAVLCCNLVAGPTRAPARPAPLTLVSGATGPAVGTLDPGPSDPAGPTPHGCRARPWPSSRRWPTPGHRALCPSGPCITQVHGAGPGACAGREHDSCRQGRWALPAVDVCMCTLCMAVWHICQSTCTLGPARGRWCARTLVTGAG